MFVISVVNSYKLRLNAKYDFHNLPGLYCRNSFVISCLSSRFHYIKVLKSCLYFSTFLMLQLYASTHYCNGSVRLLQLFQKFKIK